MALMHLPLVLASLCRAVTVARSWSGPEAGDGLVTHDAAGAETFPGRAHRSPTSLRLARPRTQRDSRRGPIDAGARDNRPAHQVPGVSMPTEPTRVARPLRSWSLPLQTDRDAPSFRTSPHNSDSSTVLASSDQLRPDVCNVYAGQARRSVFSATKANLRTRPTRNQSLQSRWAASSSSSALGPICPAISTASAANSLVSDSAMARWV